ncbi:MAG: hypothetical protein RLZ98_3534, partial [Pseudomonadota bacterium]
MKRLIRLTAAAAIAALAASPAARAEILYSESTSYFELGENLRTKNDIWKAIKRNGPLVGGKHAIGSASGGIGYHFKMRQSGGRCTITEVQFKLDVKIRLPEWQYEYQAPQDAKDFFA